MQIDEVIMGLGPFFANVYMGTVEENVFKNNPFTNPPIYLQYVNNIFVDTASLEHVSSLV